MKAKHGWLWRMLESAGSRSRELLRLFIENKPGRDVSGLCRALLSGSGEASGIALSQEILARYRQMTPEQTAGFFEMLHNEFGTNYDEIVEAASAYIRSKSEADLLRLGTVVEPPRQELLRRLNMAPNSTGELVAMRGRLLKLLGERPHLFSVDADFKHLLSSWFNRGFLYLERIDWNTPALVLEKLIQYESVHAVRGWDDLRRRLAEDRRCFAFFHPAMPDVPLIFVEVALVDGMSSEVGPLLDHRAPVLPVEQADTAVFYSINNTQDGLRGISFGNFLIKQVMDELLADCPWIKCYTTLSPMPRFAETLRAAVHGEIEKFGVREIDYLLMEWAQPLCAAAKAASPAQALLVLLDNHPGEHKSLLAAPLELIALAYLTLRRGQYRVADPVAAFHLANGARLERINPFADDSPERRKASFGCMVNYLYEPEQLEINHEAFVVEGGIAMSRPIAALYKKIQGMPGFAG